MPVCEKVAHVGTNKSHRALAPWNTKTGYFVTMVCVGHHPLKWVGFAPQIYQLRAVFDFKFWNTPLILDFFVEGFRAAMAAMPREVKVKTLEGGDITIEVRPTNTIEDLKEMLREKKHCEDPIEHNILKVKVLADGLLVDDDQTLESAGVLHVESEVTVIYSRNEVEAATKEAIHAEGLLQVNIPSSLTEIRPGAFQGCNQVVKVDIPESVTFIADAAFADCRSLECITIPESVTSIGDLAFEGCKSLASITLPESVTSIGDCAFRGCESLASIVILPSVTAIGKSAFADCESLASITIPESVTCIGDVAFHSCKSLASIIIPPSVTAIGHAAFHSCKSLTSITIPESVTRIGNAAFLHCESLARITIPESATIGHSAFDEKLQVERRHVWLCCNCWKHRFGGGALWIGDSKPQNDKLSWLELNNLKRRFVEFFKGEDIWRKYFSPPFPRYA